VEDVPRVVAELGEEDHRAADPVEDEPADELGDAAGKAGIAHDAMVPRVAPCIQGHSRDHGLMPAMVAPGTLAGLLGTRWRRPGESAHALADALRALVVDGRLGVRTRVPSERALAPALGVSRGTVTRAYDRLRDDGYLVSARGAGSWLALPDASDPGARTAEPGSREKRVIDLSVARAAEPEPLLSKRRPPRCGSSPSCGCPRLRARRLPELREAVAAASPAGARPMPIRSFRTLGRAAGLHL
jgi:hypothetical protein